MTTIEILLFVSVLGLIVAVLCVGGRLRTVREELGEAIRERATYVTVRTHREWSETKHSAHEHELEAIKEHLGIRIVRLPPAFKAEKLNEQLTSSKS